MHNDFRETQRKRQAGQAVAIVRALFILAIAVVVLFGFNIPQIIELKPLWRYSFAGLCLLYGSFRLYRGIKQEY